MFQDLAIRTSPVLPAPLFAAVLLLLVLAVGYSAFVWHRRGISGKLIAAKLFLRTLVLFVLAGFLLNPTISRTSSESPKAELLVLVDTSRSMGNADRFHATRKPLYSGPLAEHLEEHFDTRWFAFDTIARPVAPQDVTPADGADTNLARSLESALNHAQARGQHPQRVLLVTDGNDRGFDDPLEIARTHGFIIDVLLPADSTSSDPPGIESVQSAPRVLLGSETQFRILLRGSRSPGTVLAFLEDGKPVWEKPLPDTGNSFTVAYKPATLGVRKYEFQLRHPDSPAYPLTVQVIDAKHDVLILEDTWRWEYKFLHRLFDDDPSYRFTALLPRGNGAVVQFGSADRRVPLVGFPQSAADLEGFDTFVLGDVVPGRWPRGLALDMARLVREEGRSLIAIAGPNSGKWAELPELHGILPVELDAAAGTPVNGPIAVQLRADAAASPFFAKLTPDNEPLPTVDRVYPAVRKRAGATVLLEAAAERNAYGNLIVLAEHSVGRGRVLFVGTDTLWKWQTSATGDGPTPYAIFWQQAFRALTPPRSRAAEINLFVTPARSRTDRGNAVDVQLELVSAGRIPQPVIEAWVADSQGGKVSLLLVNNPRDDRQYNGRFVPREPGIHTISASVRSSNIELATGSATVTVSEYPGERDGEPVNRRAMERLTTATGGQILDPANPSTWPAVGDSEKPISQSRLYDLSLKMFLLTVVVLLLGCDWFLRLLKGLV